MARAAKTKEVILALKEVREQRGLSVQRIHSMVENNGGILSLATVKRVFSAGSEDQNFRYEDSIKPIADVLLDLGAARQPSEESATGSALRELLELKNAIIEEKIAELARVQAEAQKKIDFLREQIAEKDKQIAEKDQQIAKKDEQLNHRAYAMQERWQLIQRQFAEIDEQKEHIKKLMGEIERLRGEQK